MPDCAMQRSGFIEQLERAMHPMSTERPGGGGRLLKRQSLVASRMSLVLCSGWLLCS